MKRGIQSGDAASIVPEHGVVADNRGVSATPHLAAPPAHYENFPVASWLCPPHLRPPIAAIYHFARTADDIADEGNASPGERLADLNAYREELAAAARGEVLPASRWPQVFGPLAQGLDQLKGLHANTLIPKIIGAARRYELTSDNFSHFQAAADSVVAVAARDSAARDALQSNLTDAGSPDADAGRKWLEAIAPVNTAMTKLASMNQALRKSTCDSFSPTSVVK